MSISMSCAHSRGVRPVLKDISTPHSPPKNPLCAWPLLLAQHWGIAEFAELDHCTTDLYLLLPRYSEINY